MTMWYRYREVAVALAATMTVLASAGKREVMAAEWYVSPEGRDSNPGTLARPFATILRAQEEARKTRRDGGPITITIRGGTYELPDTLGRCILNLVDAGTTDELWFAAFRRTFGCCSRLPFRSEEASYCLNKPSHIERIPDPNRPHAPDGGGAVRSTRMCARRRGRLSPKDVLAGDPERQSLVLTYSVGGNGI